MKNIIIHCKTQKDWIRVCKKIEEDHPDVRWCDDDKPTEFEDWNSYKEKSCLYINDNQLEYGTKIWYQENQPEDPIITSQKFFGEVPEKIIMPEMEKMKELVDTFVDDWNKIKKELKK